MSPISRRTFLQQSSATALAVTTACFAARAADESSPPEREVDVLVIGAGAAGLGAARLLADQGRQVLVIEARDRLGGRVWTSRQWPDVPIDLGASWIHGHLNNPMTELAARYNARTAVTNFDSVAAYDEQGRPLGLEQLAAVLNGFDRMKLGLEQLKRQMTEQGAQPISLAEAIQRWQQSANVSDEQRRIQALITRNEIEVDSAADPDELRFPGWDDDQELAGQQRILPQGYGQIIEGLAAGLNVQLHTQVRSIDYSQPQIKVETSRGAFVAQRVIVTVSLGVLKSGMIRFVPELPAEKQAAIAQLGMGLLGKLVVRFERPFWPEQKHVLAFTSADARYWPDVFNLLPMCGQPVLVALKGGRAARADERRSEQELVESFVQQLRHAFGSKVLTPIAWQTSRWGADPLAGGSYSFPAVRGRGENYDELAAAVENRLFFAGEATHRQHPATVHGAYLSGQREAKRILSL